MKGREGGGVDTGHRVRGFLDAHAAELDIGPLVRADLDTAVSQLEGFEAEQLHATSTAIGETAVQKQMRADLYERFLGLIGQIANSKNLGDPALIIPSRLKHSDFLARLETLVVAAPKHERILVDNGLPPDFLVRLRAAIDELSASTGSRARHWSARSGATAGLKAANKAVRVEIDLLNRLLLPRLKTNAALEADWKASSKIHRTRIEPRRGGSVKPSDGEGNPK
jgi:hypothetical protein